MGFPLTLFTQKFMFIMQVLDWTTNLHQLTCLVKLDYPTIKKYLQKCKFYKIKIIILLKIELYNQACAVLIDLKSH